MTCNIISAVQYTAQACTLFEVKYTLHITTKVLSNPPTIFVTQTHTYHNFKL